MGSKTAARRHICACTGCVNPASTLMHDMGRALPDFSTAQMNFIPIVGDPLTPEDFVRGGFAHG